MYFLIQSSSALAIIDKKPSNGRFTLLCNFKALSLAVNVSATCLPLFANALFDLVLVVHQQHYQPDLIAVR